jgi:hypothetical protein
MQPLLKIHLKQAQTPLQGQDILKHNALLLWYIGLNIQTNVACLREEVFMLICSSGSVKRLY